MAADHLNDSFERLRRSINSDTSSLMVINATSFHHCYKLKPTKINPHQDKSAAMEARLKALEGERRLQISHISALDSPTDRWSASQASSIELRSSSEGRVLAGTPHAVGGNPGGLSRYSTGGGSPLHSRPATSTRRTQRLFADAEKVMVCGGIELCPGCRWLQLWHTTPKRCHAPHLTSCRRSSRSARHAPRRIRT